jgi:hypothetical protein
LGAGVPGASRRASRRRRRSRASIPACGRAPVWVCWRRR